MSYKITIEPSGLQIGCEEGESILDAALRNGINLHYGCRNAVCGVCKGALLDGSVHYAGFETPGISETERRQSFALFCRAIPTSDVRIEAEHVINPETIPIKTLAATVETITRLTADIMLLQLRPDEDKQLEFLAGQYIDILLQDGRRRSFSIANAPSSTSLIDLHIRHNKHGNYTHYIFNEMQEGESLQIEGPFGSFYFREQSNRPIIFMAGGTGFGPIKAIIEHALAEGIARPMYLYRGARTATDLYMEDIIDTWVPQSNIAYIPVLSEADTSTDWQGRTGLVHAAIVEDFNDLQNYEVYSCGPPAMVQAGRRTFVDRGLAEERYYCDAFEKAKD
jgi:CDP-4-dehydro-6-deoxyglucose reductase